MVAFVVCAAAIGIGVGVGVRVSAVVFGGGYVSIRAIRRNVIGFRRFGPFSVAKTAASLLPTALSTPHVSSVHTVHFTAFLVLSACTAIR